MNKNKLRNIVAFCALMQSGIGIVDKQPTYIEEKFNKYCLSDVNKAPRGLDRVRSSLVKKWEESWLKK